MFTARRSLARSEVRGMKSEQATKRLSNQNALLRALHLDGPARRAVLSRRLGMRKASVTSIVADLLRCGMVEVDSPGTPRSAVRLVLEGRHTLAASVTSRGFPSPAFSSMDALPTVRC